MRQTKVSVSAQLVLRIVLQVCAVNQQQKWLHVILNQARKKYKHCVGLISEKAPNFGKFRGDGRLRCAHATNQVLC